MVSRQNLSGLISRMERSRVVTMTELGRHVWQVLARPKIRAYYDDILADFSVNDVSTRCTTC